MLDWKQEDKERMRGIPPGTYRLRTVRVERVEQGVHWFISATAPPRKPLRLRSDNKITLEVPDTVHFAGRVQRKAMGHLQLGFVIEARDRSGLAIYKAGRRVPVTYEVLSGEGRSLASGRMNYG